MKREHFHSGTPWEPKVGYSRAVKVGKHIYVSGTTATDQKGNLVGEDNPYRQAVQAIKNIEAILVQAGADLSQVVRTRIFVTDITCWDEIGRAHSEFFGKTLPATSMVEVSRLIDPRMLVEIEAVAILESETSQST